MSTPHYPETPQQPSYGVANHFRPMGFGEIFSRSFSLIRQNPKPLLLGAALIPFGINLLLLIIATFPQMKMEAASQAGDVSSVLPYAVLGFVASLVQSVGSLIVVALTQGFVLSNLRESVLGNRASAGALLQGLRQVRGRLIGYAFILLGFAMGVGMVVGVFASVVIALTGVFVVSSSSISGTILMVTVMFVVLLAILAPLVWVATRVSLAPALLVLDRVSVGQAFRGSWQLTRGRFWKIFGTMTVIGLLALAAMLIVTFVVAIPMTLGMTPGDIAAANLEMPTALVSLLSVPVLLISSFAAIVQSNAVGLLAMDARMRDDWLATSLNGYTDARAAGVPAASLYDPFLSPPEAFAPYAPPYAPYTQNPPPTEQ